MDIKSKLLNILAKISEVKNVEIFVQTNESLAALGINSLSFIKLVVELENEFDVEFDDEDLDFRDFDTVTSLCEYMEKLV